MRGKVFSRSTPETVLPPRNNSPWRLLPMMMLMNERVNTFLMQEHVSQRVEEVVDDKEYDKGNTDVYLKGIDVS